MKTTMGELVFEYYKHDDVFGVRYKSVPLTLGIIAADGNDYLSFVQSHISGFAAQGIRADTLRTIADFIDAQQPKPKRRRN